MLTIEQIKEREKGREEVLQFMRNESDRLTFDAPYDDELPIRRFITNAMTLIEAQHEERRALLEQHST